MFILESAQLDMGKIADSGQIFRFNKIAEAEYELIASDKILKIEKIGEKNSGNIDGKYDVYKLDVSEEEYNIFWKNYFDMDTDYDIFSKNIPANDEFLKAAARFSRGIRILKQDKWEMLISFIISQRKSIPAIKTSIEKLSEKFGEKIGDEKYAFPTSKTLSRAGLSELGDCSLGYRAPYIHDAAKKVESGEIDLEKIDEKDDIGLLDELMKIKGVGIKVANCVALFGYHRIASFPIDVWISRMIDRHYGGRFPIELYEGYAGIIQQYIFFYGRETEKIK